jgi:uncharacterized membrane protein YfcA
LTGDLAGDLVGAWTPALLAAALLVSLGAGFVRGYAGFGYSALTVAGMSLFVAPAPVVPAVLALELLASLSVWRAAMRDADFTWTRWLLGGNLIFVPAGMALLAFLPPVPLRVVVGAVLLTAAVALRLTDRIRLAPGRPLYAVAGFSSGLLNGVAASGGVPAAMLMAASHAPARQVRATMVVFLFFSCGYALLWAALLSWQAGAALVGLATLQWLLVLAPTMFAGLWIGQHAFHRGDPGGYLRKVLALLIVISGLGLVRALAELASG